MNYELLQMRLHVVSK